MGKIGDENERAVREAEALQGFLYDYYRKKYRVRKDNRIHVSNLIEGFCPRELFLFKDTGQVLNPGRRPSIPEVITYHLGDLIESSIIDALHADGLGVLVERKYPLRLKHEGKHFSFELSAEADAVIRLGDRTYLAEIKSIDNVHNVPKVAERHSRQLSLYLKLTEMFKTTIYPGYGFKIYVSKTHNQYPIQVFPCHKLESYTDYTIEMIKSMMDCCESGELPPRTCPSDIAPPARRCRAKEACFSVVT